MEAQEVWLVYVRAGEWGDTDLLALRRSFKGAKRWCNDNRKLEQGDPIQWKPPTADGEVVGTALVPYAGKKMERFYLLAPMMLED